MSYLLNLQNGRHWLFLTNCYGLFHAYNNLSPHPSQLDRPPPRTVCAASHEWKIATGPIEHCPSRKIYDHLFKYEVPALPIARLAITTTPTAWHWAYEAQLNKHVLPVYADLKFRLQHNALGFLY
ncbi:unnamed protein product, partial [Aphanomyces euteiches]